MVKLAVDERPRFWVTIDTEEDFDWTAPSRAPAIVWLRCLRLAACQSYFERAQVRPIYLVDWPIVTDDRAVSILGQGQADGNCDIGAQLHRG